MNTAALFVLLSFTANAQAQFDGSKPPASIQPSIPRYQSSHGREDSFHPSVSPQALSGLTRENIIQMARLGTVSIHVKAAYSNNSEEEGTSSGFIVGKDAAGLPLIITNAHVVDGLDAKAASQDAGTSLEIVSKSIIVATADGATYPVTVLGFSDAKRGYDLALLRLNAPCRNCQALAMGNDSDVHTGDQVLAVGSPTILTSYVTDGIIGKLHFKTPADYSRPSSALVDDYIGTETPINPGNSGGPLIDIEYDARTRTCGKAYGTVIGVNTWADSPVDASVGLNFAIPIGYVKQMLRRYEATGTVYSADPGLTVQKTQAGSLQIISLSEDIRTQGLRTGDFIWSVDGKSFNAAIDLMRYLAGRIPGTAVGFLIDRGTAQLRVPVTLGSMD